MKNKKNRVFAIWNSIMNIPRFMQKDGTTPEEPEEAVVDDGPILVARRTPVGLGLVDERSAEILSGIEAGADVIVLGQAHLRDGARVRPPRPGDEDEDVAAAEDDE